MTKEEKIDNLLDFESSEKMSIPINFLGRYREATTSYFQM